MNNTALYMRVSTDDQTNRNQEIQLKEVTERRGWTISGIYRDEESGRKRNRPGLNEMLLDAKRGRFDVVLCVKVDRIARSLQGLLEIAGALGNYNVDLEFTDQDLDITSSQGRLMFQILGAFAEYERERSSVSERKRDLGERGKKERNSGGRRSMDPNSVLLISYGGSPWPPLPV